MDSVFSGSHGVYLDDAVSGMVVFGNIFQYMHGLATQSGGGRDNIFENNIMVHLERGAHHTDRRARAVLTNDPGDSWNLVERLQSVYEGYDHGEPLDHKAEPWLSAFPALGVMPDTYEEVVDTHWLDPEGCIFSRNLIWDSEGQILEGTWGGEGALKFYEEISDNLFDQDPLFVDEEGGDLNLSDESPAWTIPGFEAIPFDEIGPR